MIRRASMALCLVLLLGGCAASGSSAGRGDSLGGDGPRVRCLNDPVRDAGARPLFFLFCVESP